MNREQATTIKSLLPKTARYEQKCTTRRGDRAWRGAPRAPLTRTGAERDVRERLAALPYVNLTESATREPTGPYQVERKDEHP